MRFFFLVISLFFFSLAATASESVDAAGIDINTATAGRLLNAFDGIDARTASAIVAYRTKYGPFRGPDDLMKVPGVSFQLLRNNRDRVRVSVQ